MLCVPGTGKMWEFKNENKYNRKQNAGNVFGTVTVRVANVMLIMLCSGHIVVASRTVCYTYLSNSVRLQ